ncbi:hypothetical protein LJC63_08040 [Ruminococcaceae bacterium OttesenSCG-928-L11]|nr:hypothetical protein [Ruminococcaceae bacterium OttesenSCG-928-L11]
MKIIVHYPTSENMKKELANRVAEIHADAAIQYIEKLTCPTEQKDALIRSIISEKQNGKMNE